MTNLREAARFSNQNYQEIPCIQFFFFFFLSYHSEHVYLENKLNRQVIFFSFIIYCSLKVKTHLEANLATNYFMDICFPFSHKGREKRGEGETRKHILASVCLRTYDCMGLERTIKYIRNLQKALLSKKTPPPTP